MNVADRLLWLNLDFVACPVVYVDWLTLLAELRHHGLVSCNKLRVVAEHALPRSTLTISLRRVDSPGLGFPVQQHLLRLLSTPIIKQLP